ncbi:MAG: dimethylamine corrinoid protein 3 [Desulfitibacter sp. BRH_c19]|nr:MAG: dimethylamine corrinoid protein 3 [Desulfitibacter sp. BRH_c19]
MSKELILNQAREAILKCDPKKAVEVARQALAEGLDPVEVLSEGFSDGIRQVGDLFGRGELFLPELISASQVMKEASVVLEEAIEAKARKNKGKMLIATVEGDVHDIGKGIVVSLVKAQGIEVIDLGREIPVSTIIEKAVEHDVNIIGTSALLTTTMPEQKKLEGVLKKEGLKDRFKTMVGGAPCTQRWADRIGANAYAEDAAEAVTKALALLG